MSLFDQPMHWVRSDIRAQLFQIVLVYLVTINSINEKSYDDDDHDNDDCACRKYQVT